MTTIISFCFGDHTFKCFESQVRALEYLDELWDEEFQTCLLNLEMVEVHGVDTIVREGGSLSYFLKRIGDAICRLHNTVEKSS